MSIDSVFVYVDGYTGQMVLPVDYPPSSWRRVIRSGSVLPFSIRQDRSIAQTEEFHVRGYMFDGRPIYCAVGFVIKQAYQVTVVSRHLNDYAQVYDVLRREVLQFVRHEYPDAIPIDQLEGNEPFTRQEIADGIEGQAFVRKAVRVIVAVRA